MEKHISNVLNELDITISVYCNGNLCQTISLEENLPEGVLAAELCIAEGKMLYASVRGTGEIFGFTIEENGMLSLKQKVVVPGRLVSKYLSGQQ